MFLFGSRKPTPKDAIVKLRENLLLLEKREAYLQSKVDAELLTAKNNATKNKKGTIYLKTRCDLVNQAALMALKRKKQYEEEIEKISGSRLALETQVMAIESANVNLETLNAMKAGAEAMKGIHGNM